MPWLGPLLIAGSAAIGRLIAVNIAPTAILAITVWLTIRANAFSSHDLTMKQVFTSFPLDASGILLFVVLVFGLAILLQPFEIRAVRILEGYWSGNRDGAAFARVASARHRSRIRKVIRGLDADDVLVREQLISAEALDGLAVEEQAQRHRDWAEAQSRAEWAKRWRPAYPPSEVEALPTLLGNVLRAAERRAGERYHLPTVEALPRLTQYLSERMAASYNAAVDALDAAAMMALSSGAAAIVSGFAFWNDPALRWLPICLALASFLCYRGAIVAAAQHGLFMDTAFDLHRFDMLKALHLDLPRTAEEEMILAGRLEEFWKCVDAEDAREAWAGTRYWHYDEKIRPANELDATDDHDAE